MSAEDSTFAVQRGQTTYSCLGKDLAETLEFNDLIVVSRAGQAHQFKVPEALAPLEASKKPTISPNPAVIGDVTTSDMSTVQISGGSGNYEWRFGWAWNDGSFTFSGPYTTSTTDTKLADKAGELKSKIEVRDAVTGEIGDSGTKKIIVSSGVPIITSNPSISSSDGYVGTTLMVRSHGSSSNATVSRWAWNRNGGKLTGSDDVSAYNMWTPDSAGSYSFQEWFENDDGETDVHSNSINITNPPAPIFTLDSLIGSKYRDFCLGRQGYLLGETVTASCGLQNYSGVWKTQYILDDYFTGVTVLQTGGALTLDQSIVNKTIWVRPVDGSNNPIPGISPVDTGLNTGNKSIYEMFFKDIDCTWYAVRPEGTSPGDYPTENRIVFSKLEIIKSPLLSSYLPLNTPEAVWIEEYYYSASHKPILKHGYNDNQPWILDSDKNGAGETSWDKTNEINVSVYMSSDGSMNGLMTSTPAGCIRIPKRECIMKTDKQGIPRSVNPTYV